MYKSYPENTQEIPRRAYKDKNIISYAEIIHIYLKQFFFDTPENIFKRSFDLKFLFQYTIKYPEGQIKIKKIEQLTKP